LIATAFLKVSMKKKRGKSEVNDGRELEYLYMNLAA
jgi:hypothetical protein